MALDTPARIAIVGAGPIGLEAALYARFLGYDVELFERGEVCEHVRQRAHVRLFSPFVGLVSSLGLAAIEAQDENYRPPAEQSFVTGRQWLDEYLLPLARTDLIETPFTRTPRRAIGRQWLLKGDAVDDESRGDDEFRLLVCDAQGVERTVVADAVIDASGRTSQPNWLGQGGIPALGELGLRHAIDYRLPDILGSERADFAGREILIVGAGMSAASAVVALAELKRAEPATRIAWVTRREEVPPQGPVRANVDDAFERRASLTVAANQLAEQAAVVEHLPETMVERVTRDAAGRFEVQLSGRHEGPRMFDRVLALVGYRPDWELLRELHCSSDEIDERVSEGLLLSEPNCYVLGAKSAGRRGSFEFADGLRQIRELFAILGERAELDLYRNMARGRLGNG